MKYRTKLYIALFAIASMSIILALSILSTETEKMLFRILQSQTLSIAATAADALNPELVKQTSQVGAEKTPVYEQIRNQMIKLRNSNRRNDVYVSGIYTLYPDPQNPKQLLYGVDTDAEPYDIGTPYTSSDAADILQNATTYYVDPKFIPDQWGVWLSAYAPIYDQEGNYIAILGVDISATDIHMRMQQLLKFGILALLSSLFLAIIIGYYLSRKVTVSLDVLSKAVNEIGAGNLDTKVELETKDEFGKLATSINEMSKGLQERERLKLSFARYVSQHILEKILKSDAPLKLEGERRKITVLFSDIRQFTRLAENLPPEQVVALLNEYFEKMIEVIFSHFGTLDKFIGDGIMAEFGAPLDDNEQERHAIEAAIEMQKQLQLLSDKWEKEGKPRIQMGIGVHTGEAVVGNIGSEKRTEYTAIGDTVNVAARLEQATKLLQVSILVSETSFLGAKDHFNYKDLGFMSIPGRKEQIKVYTINPF